MEKKSKLINLKGQYYYDENKKQYIFDILTGSKITYKSLRYIIDPTYDITFNILFGTTGCEYRLIALLNSLLFPGNNEKKITKLEYLTNELKNFDKKWYKNSLRANITCEIEIRTVKPQSYFNYTCKIEIREPASSVSPKTAIIDHK